MTELFGRNPENTSIDGIALKVQVLIGMLSVMEGYPKDSPHKKDVFRSMENLVEQLKANQAGFRTFAPRDNIAVTVPFFDRYVQAVMHETPLDDADRNNMHALYRKYGV